MKKKGWFSASAFLVIFFVLVLTYSAEAKDLYKILGVEKNASQREVQKAFHRLSLKYHPDKNPSKSAQAKFAEINNAYEVLSDEEKRKNYDLFGDEQGRARGPEPNPFNGGFHKTDGGGGWNNFGYTTNDNSGHNSYGFGGEEGSYGQGNTFNFPFNNFGGQEKSSFFGFGGNANPFQNIFDSFFGAAKGKEGQGQRFTSYNEGKAKSSKERKNSQGGGPSSSSVEELSFKSFQKKVLDQLDTWAILFVPRASKEAQQKLQFLEQISRSLGGSIKVGYVNCEGQKRLCEQQNTWPMKILKLRLYSLRGDGKLSALDYTGEWLAADVKNYCIDVLPRFSKHIEDVGFLNDEIQMEESSPIAVLFTKKKDTPALWRALSGLFYGRIVFFDVQVHDDVDAVAKRFQVDSFPAIVGIYVNGETKVLSKGSSLEQISSSIEEVKVLLEDLERKSKAAGPKTGKTEADGGVPSLTKRNFEFVCSQDTPLCVIGIHKSSRGRDKLRQILKEISQKSLIRKGRSASTSKNPISYSVLDATKQLSFLNAFDKSVSESENLVLIAYKPKKGTYVFYDGTLNLENAENFVVEVLGGDLQLRSVIQDPVLV